MRFKNRLLMSVTAAIGMTALSAVAAQAQQYGATAAGLWRNSNGAAMVASGIAWGYNSPSEAANAAMSQCNSRGYNCRIVGTFYGPGGCGYISVGSSAAGAGYGISDTPQGAVNQCRSRGYSCNAPQGGCN